MLDSIKKLFPKSINFISSFVNRVFESRFREIGYDNYENAHCSERTLTSYLATQSEFTECCSAQSLAELIVLTPNDYSEHFRPKYRNFIPLISKGKLPVLDLFPAVAQNLGDVPINSLRASRANGHPGTQLTSLYAAEVFACSKNKK